MKPRHPIVFRRLFTVGDGIPYRVQLLVSQEELRRMECLKAGSKPQPAPDFHSRGRPADDEVLSCNDLTGRHGRTTDGDNILATCRPPRYAQRNAPRAPTFELDPTTVDSQSWCKDTTRASLQSMSSELITTDPWISFASRKRHRAPFSAAELPRVPNLMSSPAAAAAASPVQEMRLVYTGMIHYVDTLPFVFCVSSYICHHRCAPGPPLFRRLAAQPPRRCPR